VLLQEQGWHGGIAAACALSHAQLRGKGILSVTPHRPATAGLTSPERENTLGFPYTGCSATPCGEARRNPVTDSGDGNSDLR